MNIFFIGDIVGRAGRRAVRKLLPEVRSRYQPGLIIANAENAAGGFGLTEKVSRELYGYGIDCLTMGNHTWDNKDIFKFIDDESRLVRPLNYMPGVPGRGWTRIEKNGLRVGIINLVGQVFMGQHNSPLMIFDEYYPQIEKVTDYIIVDFHAEATGEKLAFAWNIAGMVAAVIGTHTHVQTADEKLLESKTAYITDAGLTGAVDSILGMKKKKVMKKYRTKLPGRYDVGTGQCQLAGVYMEINDNGQAESIERIRLKD